MRIAIPKEILFNERRVAVVPESAKRIAAKGFEVSVESGAATEAFIEDGEYEKAGARIERSTGSLLGTADVVLKINRPQFSEQGGNCELTQPGQEIIKHGVIINGFTNIPSSVPVHASQMYSRNIEKFFFHLSDGKGFKMDLNDEITRGALITHKGEISHQATKEALAKGGTT